MLAFVVLLKRLINSNLSAQRSENLTMCVISRMCHGFIILTSESLKTEHVKNAKFDVKWKLLSFGKGEENRRFIVASPDWSDRFLYLSSAKKYVTCRKNRSPKYRKGTVENIESKTGYKQRAMNILVCSSFTGLTMDFKSK